MRSCFMVIQFWWYTFRYVIEDAIPAIRPNKTVIAEEVTQITVFARDSSPESADGLFVMDDKEDVHFNLGFMTKTSMKTFRQNLIQGTTNLSVMRTLEEDHTQYASVSILCVETHICFFKAQGEYLFDKKQLINNNKLLRPSAQLTYSHFAFSLLGKMFVMKNRTKIEFPLALILQTRSSTPNYLESF